MRVNTRARTVEVRTCEATRDVSALQKAVDFLNAFMLGITLYSFKSPIYSYG